DERARKPVHGRLRARRPHCSQTGFRSRARALPQGRGAARGAGGRAFRAAARLEQQAGTLSGGEQQMLAMARALMGRPKLILMDEPTMGLSPLWVDRVLDLIAGINKDDVTVFMVEQNASPGLEIAHHAYVLQTGRIVLDGPAAELRADPRIRDAYLGGQEAALSGGPRV